MQRNLHHLDRDALLSILRNLPLYDVLSLLEVNTELHGRLKSDSLAPYWREKLHQHFPEIYVGLAGSGNVNWYEKFKEVYSSQYKNLTPRQKWLITCIKEGDIERLKRGEQIGIKNKIRRGLEAFILGGASDSKSLNFHELYVEYHIGKRTQMFLDLAVSQHNQALLDYLYSFVLSSNKDIINVDINHLLGGFSAKLIFYACSLNQSIDVLTALLEKGIDVDAAVNGSGHTPLHVAAKYGHDSLVNFLLPKVVNVNAASNQGWTPLHMAAYFGHDAVVEALLANGANIHAVTQNGGTAHFLAAQEGHLKIVERLLATVGANVNAARPDGTTSLHIAAKNGCVEMVELLLARGADVNAVSSSRRTALHYAAREGHDAVVSVLLGKGVDVNAAIVGGYTPLHEAIYDRDHDSVVKLLLASGANVNAANDAQHTPLSDAIKLKRFKSALWIYMYEVNKRDDNEQRIGLFGKKSGFSSSQKSEAAIALLTVIENDTDPSTLTPHLPALQNGRLGEIFRGLGFSTQWNGAVVKMQRP